MIAVEEGKLAQAEVEFSNGAACCVVVASKGYPTSYEKGFQVTEEQMPDDAVVYHAGTKADGDRLVTNGGRVLGVTATAENLSAAVEKAYRAVEKVHFDNAYYRKDIGKKALDILA